MTKRIVCIIPARLKSTRLPEKVLKSLLGKPILQWIFEAAQGCKLFDEIVFAVDDIKTKELVEKFGGHALMTSVDCLTGTDRLIELKNKQRVKGDIWVNWQGDEPLIQKPMIEDLLQSIHDDNDIWTLKKRCFKKDKLLDSNIVKVVTDALGRALYFSRCPIPFDRDGKGLDYFRHIGIYAYTSKALDQIASGKPCDIEKMESLEQLRFLYHGLKIRVHETTHDAYGIDLEEHLAQAEEKLLMRACCG